MLRLASLALVVLAACSGCTKSPASQEAANHAATERPTKVAVPGSETAAKGPETAGTPGTVATPGAPTPTSGDSRFRLTPEEGTVKIELAGDAKAGAETTAKVIITPGAKYKVNTEFPTKLTLETPANVKLAKAELTAGGHDKAKGDADVFDEHQLAFAVKLTPAQSGSYTINGSFKFAVCDKAGSTCLAKKEPIAIQVAAK
ncbi:MAG TPA: hypothetical protein VFQ53_39815 [Kofleriaceae bacterium]|nr:hypothetical protein [Kofleriaceae bacterium]